MPDRRRPARLTAEVIATTYSRRFGDALRAADLGMAEGVVEEALAAGVTPPAVQSLVIEPAMIRIGELWERNAISVADEHLATAISHAVLLRLFDALAVAAPRSRPKVMLAAVEGQHHVLGLRMIADLLEGAGFEVLYLGPDVPVAALRDAVVRHRPAVVGLAFAIGMNVGRLGESILAVHEVHPECRVMLGGGAIPPVIRSLGYPVVESSLEVLLTVEHLLARPAAQAPSPVLEQLASIESASREHAVERDHVAEQLAKVSVEAAERARDHARAAGAYRELSLRDPLTGLGNRRAFDDHLYDDTTRAGDRSTGALLMIDVDAFKAVNDTHGHDVGDRVLQTVGEVIAGSIRSHDLAARFGGDEFAVLLPRADVDAAAQLAERIRYRVRRRSEPPVSLSIGVAPITADARSSVLAADTALYEAKSLGRDRVATSGVVPDADRDLEPAAL